MMRVKNSMLFIIFGLIPNKEISDLSNKTMYSRNKVADNFSTEIIVNQFLKVYKTI